MGSAALGSVERPLRVAIVGAGPAGFFTADALLRRETPLYEVDLFDRLPTPFGLVRSGVAPDHQKIKAVTRVFDRTAKHPRFRFMGNVELGRDVFATDLARHYDQVVYAVGSSGDRRLGIPGEDLAGCHGATAFVGWYNGHPDFAHLKFDLSSERAIVVGVGNVAIDVARVLLRSPEELGKTDMPEYAVAALRASQVREVVLMARRGAAQVAFDTSELSDILALAGVGVSIDPSAVEPDLALIDELDPRCRKNVELMFATAKEGPRSRERVLKIELLASPVELQAGADGRMAKVRVEQNELVPSADGMKAKGTGKLFEIEAGLLFRSVGYRGVALPELPFDERSGTIPNAEGRVTRGQGGEVLPGTYAVGWIRRGPTGVIGTNKADANSVVELMLEDVAKLSAGEPGARARAAIDSLFSSKQLRVVSYADWQKLDALELAGGKEQGKVREKLWSLDAMLAALR